MSEIPDWLPAVSNPKYDEPDGFLRYRGGSSDPDTALDDLVEVLCTLPPEGYRFSHISGGGEPKRGRRITWLVAWISDELAEQKYQKARLSRFQRP